MPKLTRRDMLAASAVALPASAAIGAKPMPSEPTPPALSFAFEAMITLAPPIEHGTVDGIRKRFIPITGGTVKGPKLTGTVLPGGGDWQSIYPDGLTEIHAIYALKATDGTVISIDNPGVRVAAPDIIAKLAAGEDVDPSLYYFRTKPTFSAPAGVHDWLRRKVFVTRGIRRPDHVVVQFFVVG